MCIPTTGAKQPQYTDLDQYIGVAFGDKLCSKYGIRSRLLSTVKHLIVVCCPKRQCHNQNFIYDIIIYILRTNFLFLSVHGL